MLYGLATVLTDIADDSVSAHKAEVLGDLRYDSKNMRDNVGVFACDLVYRADVCFRHNEAVYGCLRCYIEEGVALLVIVHLI